ncbi:MAG TPA: nucleotide exchange factor GrpE [Candidatus Saccharimonadales bacterium]|nr:nucleotide exchange factor GrpE [Candidatus Saccharimonadales bacterium]
MTKKKAQNTQEKQIEELTQDLQRTRADFENYRKRVEIEKIAAREAGQASAILKLLPVIDTIERAIVYAPEELKDNKWAQGIAGLVKNLEKTLEGLNLKRIEATKGTEFNPDFHEAIQFDEDATGEKEVIAEELQAGYLLNGRPIRHAMVRVTRQ